MIRQLFNNENPMDITTTCYKEREIDELGDICVYYYRKMYKFVFSFKKDNLIYINDVANPLISTVPSKVISKVHDQAVKMGWLSDSVSEILKINFANEYNPGITIYLYNQINSPAGYIEGRISSNHDGIMKITPIEISGEFQDDFLIDAKKQIDNNGFVTVHHTDKMYWSPF